MRTRPNSDRAIVVLLLCTALRLSELVALDIADARLSARKGLLVVRAGKGDFYREVPLNKPVRDALEVWLKDRAKRVDVGDPALFVGPQGRRLSARAVDLVIRNTASRAGLRLSAHVYADLRIMPTRAAATNLLPAQESFDASAGRHNQEPVAQATSWSLAGSLAGWRRSRPPWPRSGPASRLLIVGAAQRNLFPSGPWIMPTSMRRSPHQHRTSDPVSA